MLIVRTRNLLKQGKDMKKEKGLSKSKKLIVGGVGLVAISIASSWYFSNWGVAKQALNLQTSNTELQVSEVDDCLIQKTVKARSGNISEEKVMQSISNKLKLMTVNVSLSESNRALVDAVKQGKPLELNVAGVKRQLLLAPRKIFGDDTKVRRADGTVLFDANEQIYVFAGAVSHTGFTSVC